MTNEDRKSALLVIDVQVGNTAEGYQREEVIGRIRGLIDQAEDQGAPVIWVQHHHAGSPLERGKDTWQIVEELRPPEGTDVMEKEYLDSFADTDLRERLEKLGINHLVITGAATDACIRATSARSMIEGYDTTLVSDAHTTDVGPWPLELPDGKEVPIGAEQMIAYTNFFVADTAYPGVETEVVPAADVVFGV